MTKLKLNGFSILELQQIEILKWRKTEREKLGNLIELTLPTAELRSCMTPWQFAGIQLKNLCKWREFLMRQGPFILSVIPLAIFSIHLT